GWRPPALAVAEPEAELVEPVAWPDVPLDDEPEDELPEEAVVEDEPEPEPEPCEVPELPWLPPNGSWYWLSPALWAKALDGTASAQTAASAARRGIACMGGKGSVTSARCREPRPRLRPCSARRRLRPPHGVPPPWAATPRGR